MIVPAMPVGCAAEVPFGDAPGWSAWWRSCWSGGLATVGANLGESLGVRHSLGLGRGAVSHRIRERCLDREVETLKDLLRPGLTAVCVGINPAPHGVAVGHYYQGRLGQRFCRRLRVAGILPDEPGWEDDLAFANGVGFTDIVKRPTARASEIRPEEFEYGRPLLEDKLDAAGPRLLVFSFKRTAEVLFG
jgi:double-stranded uracil-DNA glycosylase